MTRPRRWFLLVCSTIGVLVLGMVLASCDQGTSPPDLSPDEAADQINTSIDGLSESLETLEGGAFSTRFKSFLGLQNGEVTSGDWAEELIQGLDSVFETTNDDRLDFDGSTGEYAWNADQRQWEQQATSDDVVLRFPADDGSTSNNATFTLSEYEDTGVTVGQETIYLPASGAASLSVEGTEVFSIDLSNVAYETEEGLETPIPQSFTLDVLTAPHTHLFELTNDSGTDYSFSFELSNDDQLVAGLSTNVLLATDDYDELEETDIDEISGEVKIGSDLTVPYSIQAAELAQLDDPSEEEINDRFDASIEYEGQEIATLRYDEGTEEIFVVFADGSEEPASAFYQDFLDEMETVWSDYTGGGSPSVNLEAVQELVQP